MGKVQDEPRSLVIHAVAFQEGDVWVVQGIEYDITAHAADLAKLPVAFLRALEHNAYITKRLGREPFGGIKPAPEKYHRMFEAATINIPADPPPTTLPISQMAIRLAEARI